MRQPGHERQHFLQDRRIECRLRGGAACRLRHSECRLGADADAWPARARTLPCSRCRQARVTRTLSTAPASASRSTRTACAVIGSRSPRATLPERAACRRGNSFRPRGISIFFSCAPCRHFAVSVGPLEPSRRMRIESAIGPLPPPQGARFQLAPGSVPGLFLLLGTMTVAPRYFGARFLPPASGKIHMAMTMNTAVPITNVPYSGLIGEPSNKRERPRRRSPAPRRWL